MLTHFEEYLLILASLGDSLERCRTGSGAEAFPGFFLSATPGMVFPWLVTMAVLPKRAGPGSVDSHFKQIWGQMGGRMWAQTAAGRVLS